MKRSELSDPLCVPDTFVEGVGAVTKIGSCVRITFYATRDHGAGPAERIVVANLVWPITSLLMSNAQIRACFDGASFVLADFPQGLLPS